MGVEAALSGSFFVAAFMPIHQLRLVFKQHTCQAFRVMCKTLEPPLITLHFSFKEPHSFLVMYLVL